MMVCIVLMWFLLTVLHESSNLDDIFIVYRKIKKKISKLVFVPKHIEHVPFMSENSQCAYFIVNFASYFVVLMMVK